MQYLELSLRVVNYIKYLLLFFKYMLDIYYIYNYKIEGKEYFIYNCKINL